MVTMTMSSAAPTLPAKWHTQSRKAPQVLMTSENAMSAEMSQDRPTPRLDQLPPEMLEFTLLKTTGTLTPRLGRLALPGRRPILTPGFIASTSRGAIPHISQDNFRKCVGLDGVYVALEDCMYVI